ncbi:MAG TPA: diaminopimelate epimerase [Polyangia bacterium]|jgi:diaminopimelate epimerase|nr:diaminopimelate epimerase [Polyangia bacterium]
MPLPFVKAEGTGNDFVVVDLRPGQPAARAGGRSPEDPATVRAICDRHFGVGADGVLAILPSTSGDARMRVLNADGSEAEMCGNGLRCVAKVLYESDPALRRPTLNIETGAGVLVCTLDVEAGVVRSVTEEMGRPRLTRAEIPLAPGGGDGTSRALRESIRARDRDFRFTGVSMGNPHAVIFVDGDEDLRALAESYGPVLEIADRFPRRTNVEFARVRGREIDLVVWERGSGLTLACGTGACATVVAACLEERLAPGADTRVHLPGGTLVITVAPDYSGVRLCGPVRVAFQGTLDDAQLAPR